MMFQMRAGSWSFTGRLNSPLSPFVVAMLCGVYFLSPSLSCGHFDIPPQASANVYGNILIDRNSTKKGKKPVVFSHWQHRMKYTCRVCHAELDFNFKVNTTEITEAKNLKGKFCGACHNGEIAFAAAGNCDRCHNGNILKGSEKFADSLPSSLPRTPFGNGIDWAESYRERVLMPACFLTVRPQNMAFGKKLVLERAWNVPIPHAIFPHKAHKVWLDCENCHPEPFNIKKKTTENFSMDLLVKGEFCGVCHMNVAFPMQDCDRCHPKT
jgi:c(7)-type cytochrome triheme protein